MTLFNLIYQFYCILFYIIFIYTWLTSLFLSFFLCFCQIHLFFMTLWRIARCKRYLFSSLYNCLDLWLSWPAQFVSRFWLLSWTFSTIKIFCSNFHDRKICMLIKVFFLITIKILAILSMKIYRVMMPINRIINLLFWLWFLLIIGLVGILKDSLLFWHNSPFRLILWNIIKIAAMFWNRMWVLMF